MSEISWLIRLRIFFVRLLPVEVVVPRVLGKNHLHSFSALSMPPPASSSLTESNRRRAFFGLRSK